MDESREFYFYTKGLAVGYQGIPLVKNIELRVRRGEIVTLIGPNGAGKTTILKTLIQQLPSVNGAVVLDGTDMRKQTDVQLSKKMSVVLTERVRTELMTCEEVVAAGRYPYTGRFGRLTDKDRRIVEEAMELVHIQELAGRDFGKISDGQKQRVLLAKAFCQEPKLLVLDEPTSFLDIRFKLEFLSILQKMSREHNLTVIMSLHELELAERISDKIVCVKGDRVDRFGTPEEVFTSGYIESLFGVASGAYDERSGAAELEAAAGKPEVFVIGGNGRGTPVYRRLQRAGIPFSTGILWENDLDYPTAGMLAAEVVSVRPFCRIGTEQLSHAKRLIDGSRQVVCALNREETGEFFQEAELLCRYAEGKLMEKGFDKVCGTDYDIIHRKG